MRNKSYRVREFAELAGVTVKALHHYGRLGLLKPARTEAGYRVYSPADLARLEQIVALRFLGIPLKQMRGLLDRDALPLRSTFRQQREVLEDQRRRLDRAVAALVEAERAIEAGEATAAPILQKLIGVIAVQEIDVMQKYFSDEAWAAWKHHYEGWPSSEWQALYRDIAAAIGADPAVETAQTLASRWLTLTLGDSSVPGVRTGLMKAWADREHWPPILKRRMAEFNIERATQFINDALWIRWDAEREAQQRTGTAAPSRVSESRRALFRDCALILDAAASSEAAQSVVARWRAGGCRNRRRRRDQGRHVEGLPRPQELARRPETLLGVDLRAGHAHVGARHRFHRAGQRADVARPFQGRVRGATAAP